MPRSMSLFRRRTNIIDLTIRRRPNIIGFRFNASTNFDVAFAPFQVVPNDGFIKLRTPALGGPRTPSDPLNPSQSRGLVRFVFDPDEYTATVPAVRDDTPFFVNIESQNPDGTFNSIEAMHLIMPYSTTPDRIITLSGTVAAGVALVNSIEIQLPMQVNDINIKNTGANDLYVAFERPGSEIVIETAAPIDHNHYVGVYATTSQIFIRSNVAATTMNATFGVKNNPIA